MATFWVDQSRPDDTGDGLTFATAKKTLAAGYALLTNKGDILNMVNSGQYPWPTADLEVSADPGTSFSDFGYLIRGVTGASETPGYATIATDTLDADAIRRVFRINAGGGWLILRNLIFDDTEKAADANIHTVVRYNSPGGPVWFDGCAFLAGASGVAHAGTHQFLNVQAGTVDSTRIWDCYFQNMQSPLHGVTGGASSISHIGNLFYFDVAGVSPTLITRTLGGGTGDTFDFTYNTLYWSIGNNALSTPISYAMGGAADAGPFNVNSNLVFIDSTAAVPNIEFITDSGGPIPFSGTLGFNVLLGGPNVVVGDLNADGWYVGDTFDVGADPKATDQAAYSQAEATIFNAPASTYAWDALGNGATITILKDLRPRVFLTVGVGSTVPGALPAASTDFSVALLASRLHPEIGDTVTLTMTLTNTGSTANSIIATLPVPAGVTLVSSAVSQGSYNSGTGQWTVGTMLSGTANTLELVFTINADQGGETITATATYVSSDITDTNSSNNISSVDIEVVDDDDPIGGGGGGDGANPYIDVLPIFTDYMQLDASCRLQTRVNRVVRSYNRFDKRRGRFREFDTKRVTIAGSTTASINMGGIERARFLAVEATGPVEISISTSVDTYWPQATFLLVGMTDFEILKVRNPLTTSVDVLITAVD